MRKSFNALELFSEIQAIIDVQRETDNREGSAGRKSFLSGRGAAGDSLCAAQIYTMLSENILEAEKFLKSSNIPKESSENEKLPILGQYFERPYGQRRRVHVIQGPPGTGKTELSAMYILLYLLEWHWTSEDTRSPAPTIVVSACTHKAVDNVLLRVENLFPIFYAFFNREASKCNSENAAPPNRDQSFARLIKIHAVQRRSQFADPSSRRGVASSIYSPSLVFGVPSDLPIYDTNRVLGLHDMSVNFGELSWFEEDPIRENADSEKGGSSETVADSAPQNCPQHLLGEIRAFNVPTIIGCTASQLIKMKAMQRGESSIFQTDFLVLDEASMMMLPDFLLLASRVREETGLLVVVGDDLQLGPISQNDWSREIRPSLRNSKPWNSVFKYLRNRLRPEPILDSSAKPTGLFKVAYHCEASAAWAALQKTFRLTEGGTELIKPVYDRQNIALKHSPRKVEERVNRVGPYPAFPEGSEVIVAHYTGGAMENASNPFEVKVVTALVDALNSPNGLKRRIAIVTPFHDQIRLLRGTIHNSDILIDTVEKLQGDQRDIVIFSAVVSGAEGLATYGSFLLELQRTNVAFTRAKELLIVVVSNSLLEHIPSDYVQYQGSLLWKNLNLVCTEEWSGSPKLNQFSEMLQFHVRREKARIEEERKLEEDQARRLNDSIRFIHEKQGGFREMLSAFIDEFELDNVKTAKSKEQPINVNPNYELIIAFADWCKEVSENRQLDEAVLRVGLEKFRNVSLEPLAGSDLSPLLEWTKTRADYFSRLHKTLCAEMNNINPGAWHTSAQMCNETWSDLGSRFTTLSENIAGLTQQRG